MRSIFFMAGLLCFQAVLHAQTDRRDINKDVWYPFMRAYEQLDASAFLSLHTPDLIRVSANQPGIKGLETYRIECESMFAGARAGRSRFRIDFRFIRRMSDGHRAYEEGYFRFASFQGSDSSFAYGKFTVILRKDEKWRIAVDSDQPVVNGRELFEAAQKLEEQD